VSETGETPDISAQGPPDFMYLERQPEQDNHKHNFPIQYSLASTFFVWALPTQDPFGPSTAGAYPYSSWRQAIWLATGSVVTLPEQGGSGSSYTGTIGSVTQLQSDKLKAVPFDTTDEDGDPLPATDPDTGTPLPTVSGSPVIKYPATLATADMSGAGADPTQSELVGVAYGSPPFALNGWDPVAPPNGTFSALSFGTSESTSTSSTEENSGGISLGFDAKIPVPGVGIATDAMMSGGASAGWSIDKSTTHSTQSTKSETWSTGPGGPYGQMYMKQPVWELQRFQREDYTGAQIPQEYLVSWNCVDGAKVEGAFAFNMTAPGTADPQAPLNSHFSGMTGAPSTYDYFNWYQREDPVAMAGKHGHVVQMPDKTPLQATVTGNAAASTLYTANFSSGTALTKSMSNSMNIKAHFLFIKANYSHTWSHSSTTTTGSSFQFSWQLPGAAVTVPDVMGLPVQQALDILAAAGLTPSYQEAAGSATTPGTVVSQQYFPGSRVNAGAAVTVSIAPLQGAPKPTVPTPATIRPEVSQMTVEGVYMEADDDQAYWIPDAYRSHADGQSQKPWCVDWHVLSYTPGNATVSEETPLSCGVKVRPRPVRGGSARVLTGAEKAAHYGQTGADGVQIAASPALGYRFAGWRLHGKGVGRLVGASERLARVLPRLAGGGVTVTARFVRVRPQSVEIERVDADSAHVRVVAAPLARAWAGPTAADRVAVKVGDDLYAVPASAWRPLARFDGKVVRFGASFVPRGWKQRDDRLTVVVDTRANTFTVRALGADGVDDLYRDAAAGRLTMSLLAGGRAISHQDYPVACTMRFKHRRVVRSATAAPATGRVQPVRLGGAELLVSVDPDDYRRSRVALSDVRIAPELLDRAGFTLGVNGIAAQMGAARRSGSTFVARGRTTDGVVMTCRWTRDGTTRISLARGYLESDLQTVVGRNVVVEVGDGVDAAAGTMVASLRGASSLRYASRLTGD
jgi:hypothetical protein